MLRICSIIVLILPCLVGQAKAARLIAGEARVIDGDTLEVAGQTVRLFGIDAPEHDQTCTQNGVSWRCGAWSEDMLALAIGAQEISCTGSEVDRYGRLLAQCEAGGQDLGKTLVRSGAALAYLRYSAVYEGDETHARAAKVGIWQGDMVAPETHRAPVPVSGADPDCKIKGNISDSGYIFHSPGQRDYASVRINPAKGEAWFCSAAEAEAAGFRSARR